MSVSDGVVAYWLMDSHLPARQQQSNDLEDLRSLWGVWENGRVLIKSTCCDCAVCVILVTPLIPGAGRFTSLTKIVGNVFNCRRGRRKKQKKRGSRLMGKKKGKRKTGHGRNFFRGGSLLLWSAASWIKHFRAFNQHSFFVPTGGVA